MTSTIYDIRVRYELAGQADKGIDRIERSARRANRSIGLLGSGMRILAAAAAGGYGMYQAKKALIDYNASLETTKNAMAGLIQLNLGGSFTHAMRDANTVVEQFREDAKRSAGTMQDFANFGQLIVGPVTRAGLGMKELRDLTKAGVVAAHAFGIEADVAARDIEQALAGTTSLKDRFFRAIMEPMGVSTKEWNKMMREKPKEATKLLMEAFNQPGLKNMAEAYGRSWDGVTSTLKDNLQQLFGKVGLPLMAKMSDQIKQWNLWFEKNEQAVETWANKMGDALVDAYRFAAKTIKFIIDNKELLLTMAKAYLAVKAGGLLGSALMGPAGYFDSLGKESKKAAKGLAGFASKLGMAAQGLGVLYVAAQGIADWVDRKQTETIDNISDRGYFNDRLRDFGTAEQQQRVWKALMNRDATMLSANVRNSARGILNKAQDFGFVDERGNVNRNAIQRKLGIYGFDHQERIDRVQGAILQALEIDRLRREETSKEHVAALGKVYGDFVKRQGSIFDRLTMGATAVPGSLYGLLGNLAEKNRRKQHNGSPTNIDVKVQRMEVVSDDPDRIALVLGNALHQVAVNRTQSRRQFPGSREGR